MNRLCEYVMRTSLIYDSLRAGLRPVARCTHLRAQRPCGFAWGHLKVNCPEGAREATLGCPQRGRLWDFFHDNDSAFWPQRGLSFFGPEWYNRIDN